MPFKSPFSNNYGWVTSRDHDYAPRTHDRAGRELLALQAVLSDPELLKLEKVLGYKVVLGVQVGQRTLHLRVYDRLKVETKPDNLSSRFGYPDEATYFVFNAQGGLELVEGMLKEHCRGSAPAFYASRRLPPARVQQLDAVERQAVSAAHEKLGLPKAAKPLTTEEYETVFLVEPPTLEPTEQ